MKKNTKIKMLISALAVLAVAPVAGVAALNAQAEEATRANYEVVGASIKYKASEQDDQNGIRFAIDMEDALYAQTIAQENVEMGTLIIPADLLGENELTVATANANKKVTYSNVEGAEVDSVWGQAEDAQYTRSIVYLWGINEASFNRPLTVVGYYTVGETTTYTAPYTVAVADVALEAIADPETAEEKKAELNAYVKEYAVTFYDEDGTTVLDTKQVKYGATVTYAGETPAKAATADTIYEFIGWDKESFVVTGTTSYVATYAEHKEVMAKVATTTVTKTDGQWVMTNSDTSAMYKYAIDGLFIEKEIARGATALNIIFGCLNDKTAAANGEGLWRDTQAAMEVYTKDGNTVKLHNGYQSGLKYTPYSSGGAPWEYQLTVDLTNADYDYAKGVVISQQPKSNSGAVTPKAIVKLLDYVYPYNVNNDWTYFETDGTYTYDAKSETITVTNARVTGTSTATYITFKPEYMKAKADLGYTSMTFTVASKAGQHTTRQVLGVLANGAVVTAPVTITEDMITNGYKLAVSTTDNFGTGWNPKNKADGYIVKVEFAPIAFKDRAFAANTAVSSVTYDATTKAYTITKVDTTANGYNTTISGLAIAEQIAAGATSLRIAFDLSYAASMPWVEVIGTTTSNEGHHYNRNNLSSDTTANIKYTDINLTDTTMDFSKGITIVLTQATARMTLTFTYATQQA